MNKQAPVSYFFGVTHLDRRFLARLAKRVEAHQCAINPICNGLRQYFRPYVDCLNGLVAHGLCGFSGRSTQQVDCSLFFHAAECNSYYKLAP